MAKEIDLGPGIEVSIETMPLSADARAELGRRGITLPPELAAAVAARRESYLAGRLCAARAIERAGGQGLCGRSLEGMPVWPAGFVGSVAHTPGRAIAAAAPASRARAIGVDVEGPVADWKRVLARVGVAEEQAVPPGMSGEEWTALVFSAKESLYKALFPLVGRFFGFSAARIEGGGPGEFRWTLREDLGGEWRGGRRGEGRWVARDPGLVTAVTIAPIV